ncbi:MAG: TIGR03773 family transporter-associated surface protein [Winkia neuii]|uniref:TIGR03773 family transporter-associated surface protein n=1 Tax=Winkia neuii TaxID=33007 RepID=UPI00290474B7|nr:TIGR03773 family transporter-associated surface protein [Winkia neuii]MDU3135066.1 TIGR03773 family transporter-associated surface protein [Winkia neuii]
MAVKQILAALASGILALSLSPSASAAPNYIDQGHADIFTVSATENTLTLNAHVDPTDRFEGGTFKPEELILGVKDAAWQTETTSINDLGVPGYLLPENSSANLLWPGWDTKGVAKAGYEKVTLQFLEVAGPGRVFAFQNDLGALKAVANGGFALTSGSEIVQERPGHTHASWLFEKPGRYTMKVVAKTEKEGKTLTSRPHVYAWQVGGAGLDRSADSNKNERNGKSATPAPLAQAGAAGTSENADAKPTSAATPNQSATETAQKDAGGAEEAQGEDCKLVENSGESLQAVLKDDRSAPAKWVDPSSIVFPLGQAARRSLPTQMGPVPKGTVWMIGSTQTKNVPWLGANTMHESLLEKTTGPVRWKLSSFSGPGNMYVFTSGNFGEVVGQKWFTGANNTATGQVEIPHNTHVHPNWIFTKPGLYKVGITQTAKSKDGKEMNAHTTLHFKVGEGSMHGHFDLGAKIGTGGKVWRNSKGEECTPPSGLASTGSSALTGPLAVFAAGLAVFGLGVVARRKCAN